MGRARKFAACFLSMILCASVFCFRANAEVTPQLDSASYAALGQKLDEYLRRIEPLDFHTQEEECDFLISSCKDSAARQFTALKVYTHYLHSKVMGAEAVAIYLTDNWFAPGKVQMHSSIDLMNAKIFADFNRQSLIGMRAPALELKRMDGGTAALFGKPDGRRRILYFYDTGCANCLAQSVMLRSLLDNSDYDVELDAVYTGADSTAWKKYVESHLSFVRKDVSVNHLWDPEVNSDFQRKYGVLQTPRMFLVDRDGIIIGRGLDAPVLAQMLDKVADEDNYEYGNESSIQLYNRIFVSLGENYGVDDLRSLVDHIAERTSGDNQTFRETMGDLFYYLSYQQDGRCKEAEKYLCDNYILSRPDIWAGPSDSLKVMGFAKTMSDLLSRSMPGSHVPNVSVRGVYGRGSFSEDSKFSAKRYRLDKLRGSDTYVMFYYRGCSLCKEYMEAAGDLLSSGRKILFVSVSADEQPNLEELLDKFDLTSLPFVLRIGRHGEVLERYVDFRRLKASAGK